MIDQPHTHPEAGPQGHRGGAHGWMMIACCIPMLVIAGALVLTGVVSPGFILVAVACTAMMALMMRGMDHGGTDRDDVDHPGRSSHVGHQR
jgi:hypothetical protein